MNTERTTFSLEPVPDLAEPNHVATDMSGSNLGRHYCVKVLTVRGTLANLAS